MVSMADEGHSGPHVNSLLGKLLEEPAWDGSSD